MTPGKFKESQPTTDPPSLPINANFRYHQSAHGPYISTEGSRTLPQKDIDTALERFNRQDWGGVLAHQWRTNSICAQTGEGFILAKYHAALTPVWIQKARHSTPVIALDQECQEHAPK